MYINQLCKTCHRYQNGCDVLTQIQNIADTYGIDIEIKVFKCAAHKKCM